MIYIKRFVIGLFTVVVVYLAMVLMAKFPIVAVVACGGITVSVVGYAVCSVLGID